MAILKIARMGHPLLRRKAGPVSDPTAPHLRRLIADMAETMYAAPGVGLAAPQVFAGVRVILFSAPADRVGSGEDDSPEIALINPELEPLGERVVCGAEGCLSVPGLRGIVPRWSHIGYRGWLSDGTFIEREAKGFLARVIQHEFDHLNGFLYVDRIPDLRMLGYEAEMSDFQYDDLMGDADGNRIDREAADADDGGEAAPMRA